jgi:hypothetical protein
MMPDETEISFGTLPWYRKLGVVFSWIMLFVYSPVSAITGLVMLGGGALTRNWRQERQFFRRMQHAGRVLPMAEVRNRVEFDGGTLIIEYFKGGRTSRAWWTRENVCNAAPFARPDLVWDTAEERSRQMQWDAWCWKRYLCPGGGTAYLLRSWNGAKAQCVLTRWSSQLQVLTIRSDGDAPLEAA